MGLPHRNYSVFKQTPSNQLEVKVVEDRNPGERSEGPFSRREEGWELGEGKEKRKRKRKKKAWGEHQRIYIRRSIRKVGLELSIPIS